VQRGMFGTKKQRWFGGGQEAKQGISIGLFILGAWNKDVVENSYGCGEVGTI